MDFFSSEEIVASLGDKAEMKGKLSFVRLCILGIMAGFCIALGLSLIHISEPTRQPMISRMPSSA